LVLDGKKKKMKVEEVRSEKLYDLQSSPSVIRLIGSTKVRWAGHVLRMVDNRNLYGDWVDTSEEKRLLEDLDVDGRIILK
jgi:hypothetical protein